MKKLLILSAALLLAGCASTGVVQVGQNRYMIADSNSMYWEGGSVMKDIVKEGTEFCAKQGKQFELLEKKTDDYQMGTIFGGTKKASAEIYFTCK